MVTATIEEQLAKADEAEAALSAEIEVLEEKRRALSLDAVGDAKVRQRLVNLEDDLISRRRGRDLMRAAQEEARRRLAARADAQADAWRAAREQEYARLVAERERTYCDVEEKVAALSDVITSIISTDGRLQNAAWQVEVPAPRRAVDVLSGYIGFHLTRAGLYLGQGLLHEAYGAAISSSGQEAAARQREEERSVAEAAQREVEAQQAEQKALRQAEEETERVRLEAAHQAAQAEERTQS